MSGALNVGSRYGRMGVWSVMKRGGARGRTEYCFKNVSALKDNGLDGFGRKLDDSRDKKRNNLLRFPTKRNGNFIDQDSKK